MLMEREDDDDPRETWAVVDLARPFGPSVERTLWLTLWAMEIGEYS